MDNLNTLLVSQQGDVLKVSLHRPQLANAMNLVMVNELNQVMDYVTAHDIRVLVISGSAGNFCAGGDIKDMQAARGDREELIRINRAFGLMIEKANNLPCIVISALEGAVLGGGFGLACISDVAISSTSAKFAMPETSLGILPAQIAPFVVERIGLTHARRLALLGLRIDAQQALSLGIIHQIASDEGDLAQQVDAAIALALNCAPSASKMTKALLHRTGTVAMSDLLDQAAQDFAESVAGEGIEGATAFAQKRKPSWRQS